MPLPKSPLESYLETSNTAFLDELQNQGERFPAWHLEMLRDRERFEFYKKIIQGKVKDKVVLDIGSGSGILSHLSLRFGAKKVYSIEFNPHLQAVYSHLMARPMAEGKAVLLKMDAYDLCLEEFGDDRPEVIVHEIFGSNGLSEDVISVFDMLKRKGISEGVTILPAQCEILIQPVYSKYYDTCFELKDFEGFPLSQLSVLGSWRPLDLSYEHADKWTTTGKEEYLAVIDLASPVMEKSFSVELPSLAGCSHLRLSIRLIGDDIFLLSNHGTQFSHWSNLYFPVPAWHRHSKAMTANFSLNENEIQLRKIAPATF